MNSSIRHFLRDDDVTTAEQAEILSIALDIKNDPYKFTPFNGTSHLASNVVPNKNNSPENNSLENNSLENILPEENPANQTVPNKINSGPKSVAIIFDKSSTRTRVSFATGVAHLGGYPLVLDGKETQLGRGESISDTRHVLERMCAMVVWRTFDQSRVEEMASGSVPVINALTDQFHPCQILSDLQTVVEEFGVGTTNEDKINSVRGRSFVYYGDGANNMAHSYLLGFTIAGLNVKIVCPESHMPDSKVVEDARKLAELNGTKIEILSINSPEEAAAAAKGADVITTDTWVSMGDDSSKSDLAGIFSKYQVNDATFENANDDAIFIHCLPAYRGYEVTESIIDGPMTRVWDEAENRLHAQKALMIWLAKFN
jgi:ornithine carbamoyltransferase